MIGPELRKRADELDQLALKMADQATTLRNAAIYVESLEKQRKPPVPVQKPGFVSLFPDGED